MKETDVFTAIQKLRYPNFNALVGAIHESPVQYCLCIDFDMISLLNG